MAKKVNKVVEFETEIFRDEDGDGNPIGWHAVVWCKGSGVGVFDCTTETREAVVAATRAACEELECDAGV
jgi:hypothetical protein